MRNRELESLAFETAARKAGYTRIAGVDEAGRGPLAGPVVAAACILPPDLLLPDVNDSKKLTRERRRALHYHLTHHADITFGIGVIDAPTIDAINIYQATIRAMQEAVSQIDPDYLLVDGLNLPHALPTEKIIHGDERCHAIACASIIAKEHRDLLMEAYAKKYPEYGFEQHKGYGTERHRAALEKFGPTPIHRRSFRSG
ncbi:MAG: ribonuclease HII [Parachlamydiales bacterium]